jgi:hypothetical protein
MMDVVVADEVDQLNALVERLYGVEMMLSALGQLTEKDYDPLALAYADRLGDEVLEAAAAIVSDLHIGTVIPEQLRQIASRDATDILTAAFTHDREEIRSALERAVNHIPPQSLEQPSRGSLGALALAVGIGVLAPTTGAPLAALVVKESVATETIKASITALVSGLVVEGAQRITTGSQPKVHDEPRADLDPNSNDRLPPHEFTNNIEFERYQEEKPGPANPNVEAPRRDERGPGTRSR